MLRSTFYSFTTALRGMNTAQKQLDITGHNISNSGTQGYTRQRADIFSAVPAGYGQRYGSPNANMIGQGVVVGKIAQVRDQFLDVRFRREAANKSEQDARLSTMKDMSEIFDEIEKSGLMTSFNEFVSRLQVLANNAESPEFDSIVRDSAQALVNQLNHYAKQVNTIREEQEYNLREVTVSSINDVLGNIAKLNKSIREVQANGGDALELKDERNLLIDELSNYVRVEVNYDPKYLTDDIVVDDVTINMVNDDGSKKMLIFNDTAAELKVKTRGKDGTDRAIVTVDASAIPAKEKTVSLENLLKAMAISNNTIAGVKEELRLPKVPNGKSKLEEYIERVTVKYPGLAANYPADFPVMFQEPTLAAMSREDLEIKLGEKVDRLLQIVEDPADGLNKKIKDATEAAVTALKAYEAKLKDPTATAAELQALKLAWVNAGKAQKDLEDQRIVVLDIRKELNKYSKAVKDANADAVKLHKAIEKNLDENGIVPKQVYDTPGDYRTGYYIFERGGAPINDGGGNPIKWKSSDGFEKIDRDKLANDLGIRYEDSFDVESFGTPGALRGAMDMLNSEGQFDYASNANRGIGYYEKLLDTLADKIATTLNAINDKRSTDGVKENLFETADKSTKFTAKNIRISQDWIDGKYGITNTQKVQPGLNDAKNDNILLMISTITQRLQYTTGRVANQNAEGKYVNAAGDVVADSVDKEGNYVLRFNPDGTENVPPTKVANKDGIDYKPDGSLDAKMIKQPPTVLVKDPGTNPVTYKDPDTNAVVANGRDKNGNYTFTETLAGVTTTKFVAASDGKLYKDDAGNVVANARDKLGNYVKTTFVNDKRVDTIMANDYGVMYKTDGAGNLEKDANGFPVLNANHNKMQSRGESFIYRGTFQEYLTNMGNVLALDISSTSNLSENHKAVIESIQTSKDSISSVSLDEEGVNIMQYQKAYNAAARVMTALDEAIERIINSMGVVGR